MTNYKKLKEKIIEAVPEIMELKFGCIVFKKNELRKYRVIANNVFYKEDKIYLKLETIPQKSVRQSNRIINSKYFFKEEYKIIGRDITLEDVFVAIEKTDLSNSILYKKQEWDLKYFTANSVLTLIDLWQLNKPLQKQSDELHNFLFDILCKN